MWGITQKVPFKNAGKLKGAAEHPEYRRFVPSENAEHDERMKMDFDELKNPELQARLRDVKAPEELLEIAKEYGIELDEAQLSAVSGGAWCYDKCPDFFICSNDGPLG